ncbi:leucine-rich repeat extensin-like protein 3 [Zingiber officinale]|uniref:leucine-rich repeat extensin-like protein 3 n=1 Tax=Zingiber officinale TaxID=94328 RepID=UPI001C4BEBB9|nr:leucine-rich repeat extensin-like protein 3 [Zingiber officinale]
MDFHYVYVSDFRFGIIWISGDFLVRNFEVKWALDSDGTSPDDMRRSTRATALRCGAGRPCKRTLESLATDAPEIRIGVEPVSQGRTAGASGSQTPMTLLEVPTSAALVVPTSTGPTVPPAVPPAYPTPPPLGPAVYPAPVAPVPPVPSVYPAPAPAPAVLVTPLPVPSSTIPLAAATYAYPTVPPAASAPVYAASPGIPPPAYPASRDCSLKTQHIASGVIAHGGLHSQSGIRQGGRRLPPSHRQQGTASPSAAAFGMLEQEYPNILIDIGSSHSFIFRTFMQEIGRLLTFRPQ